MLIDKSYGINFSQVWNFCVYVKNGLWIFLNVWLVSLDVLIYLFIEIHCIEIYIYSESINLFLWIFIKLWIRNSYWNFVF